MRDRHIQMEAPETRFADSELCGVCARWKKCLAPEACRNSEPMFDANPWASKAIGVVLVIAVLVVAWVVLWK